MTFFKQNLRALFSRPTAQIQAIDGLRAWSVFFVLIFHCFFLPSRVLSPQDYFNFVHSAPWWLTWIWHGDKGVDTFFVISGFLVGSILMAEDLTRNSINLKKFYLRRVFRIWPAYWLLLLLYLLGDPTHVKYLWASLLFVNNIISSETFIAPWTWSITVEMQFYLLFPLFYLLILKKSQHKGTWFLALFILANLIRLALLIANPTLYQQPLFEQIFDLNPGSSLAFADALYVNLYTRCGPFFLGLMLANFWTFQKDRTEMVLAAKPWLSPLAVATGLFLIGINTLIPYHDPQSSYSHWAGPITNLLVITFNRNLFSLGIALLLFACLFPKGASKYIQGILSNKIFIVFSNTSYSIYLFHLPLLIVAAYIVYAGGVPINQVKDLQLQSLINYPQQLFLAGIGLILASFFASLVFIFLERPMINVGHRLTSKKHNH